QACERFTIDLRVNWIRFNRLTHQTVGLPKIDAFLLAQIAEPKGRQVAQISQAALRTEANEFKLVFEQVGLRGDFERAAVVFRATNNDQRDFSRLPFDADPKMVKFVIEDFARALPPVSEDAQAGFEFEIHRVGDATVGTGARDGKKVARLFGLLERRGEPERNVTDFAARQ